MESVWDCLRVDMLFVFQADGEAEARFLITERRRCWPGDGEEGFSSSLRNFGEIVVMFMRPGLLSIWPCFGCIALSLS